MYVSDAADPCLFNNIIHSYTVEMQFVKVWIQIKEKETGNKELCTSQLT